MTEFAYCFVIALILFLAAGSFLGVPVIITLAVFAILHVI